MKTLTLLLIGLLAVSAQAAPRLVKQQREVPATMSKRATPPTPPQVVAALPPEEPIVIKPTFGVSLADWFFITNNRVAFLTAQLSTRTAQNAPQKELDDLKSRLDELTDARDMLVICTTAR